MRKKLSSKLLLFCFLSSIGLSLVANMTPKSALEVKGVYVSSLPSDGDAWTENNNATYPWTTHSSYAASLSFSTEKSKIGSYSLKANHTASATTMWLCLKFGPQSVASYEAIEFWVYPLWKNDTQVVSIHIGSTQWDSPNFYWKTQFANNTWCKVYMPFQGFLMSGSPSPASVQYLWLSVTDLLASDGVALYIDGIHFLTNPVPAVAGNLNSTWLANWWNHIPKYQEKSNVVYEGRSYTSVYDWIELDGARLRGGQEIENLAQSVYALAYLYKEVPSDSYLNLAIDYTEFLLQARRSALVGGVVQFYNNATSTWSDEATSTFNGWALAAFSLMYSVTGNNTYRTCANHIMDLLVDDNSFWNATEHTWDFHYGNSSGWSYAETSMWDMKGGSVLTGLGAYYRFVAQNNTIKSVVEDYYRNARACVAGTSQMNNISMGNIVETTVYNAWGMYENWQAFSNITYLDELDNISYLYYACDRVTENGSVTRLPYLNNVDGISDGVNEGLEGWGSGMGIPLLMILYENLPSEFIEKVFERYVFDWLCQELNQSIWNIEFAPHRPDMAGRCYSALPLFVHLGLLKYFRNFIHTPHVLLTTGKIAESVYTDDQLIFTVADASNVPSTTEIFCGEKREPKAMSSANETLTWSYNAYATTLIATHTSQTKIVVSWEPLRAPKPAGYPNVRRY